MKKKIVVVLVMISLIFGSSSVYAKGGGVHVSSHVSPHSTSSSHVSSDAHSTSTSHSTSSSEKVSGSSGESHSTSGSSKSSVGSKTVSSKSFSEVIHSTTSSSSRPVSYSDYISSHDSSWPLIMRCYYFGTNQTTDEDDDKKNEDK